MRIAHRGATCRASERCDAPIWTDSNARRTYLCLCSRLGGNLWVQKLTTVSGENCPVFRRRGARWYAFISWVWRGRAGRAPGAGNRAEKTAWRSRSRTHSSDRPSAAQVSKKKGGNPAAEQRKAEKAKQLARNKQERQLQREAMLHVNDPAYLRAQLKELLDEEEHSGVLSSAQRLKKKTLQTAYEAALKKQIHAEAEKKRREAREGVIMGVSAIPLPSMPLPPGAKATMAERAERASAPLASPSGPPPPQQQGYVMKSGGSAGGVVVSGASTVVARPKAQHDVALTSLVPSAVARGGGAGEGGMRPRGVKKAEAVPDNLDEFLNSLK